MTILVATADGLREEDGRQDLAGHDVTAVDPNGMWAVADGKGLCRRDGDGWHEVAVVPDDPATTLVAGPSGVFVGTAGAHLLRLDGEALVPVAAFDDAPGRETWGTPWGGPPDVRSLAAAPDGTLYVNVHVGGVVRSTDDGETWTPTIDVDADVHQVIADPESGLVLAAAAVGFAVSTDHGETWRVDTDGLHGTYSRAVAVAGDHVLLTASDGPFTRQAALYRRPLDSQGPFTRVNDGLPDWFAHNVDSHWVAARGDDAALVTQEGDLYRSTDAGASWTRVDTGLREPRAVVVR
jgi:hypothetical protein